MNQEQYTNSSKSAAKHCTFAKRHPPVARTQRLLAWHRDDSPRAAAAHTAPRRPTRSYSSSTPARAPVMPRVCIQTRAQTRETAASAVLVVRVDALVATSPPRGSLRGTYPRHSSRPSRARRRLFSKRRNAEDRNATQRKAVNARLSKQVRSTHIMAACIYIPHTDCTSTSKYVRAFRPRSFYHVYPILEKHITVL